MIQHPGYCVVPRVLGAAEIEKVLQALRSYTDSTRLLLNQPYFATLAADLPGRIPAVENLTPVLATYFYKSSGHNWGVAPHQDLQVPVADNNVGTWRNPTIKEGVPFIQAPESVLQDCVNVRLQLDALSEGDLTLQQGDENKAVSLVPGDALIFSPLAVHSSAKLSGDNKMRRTVQILYGPERLPAPYAWYS